MVLVYFKSRKDILFGVVIWGTMLVTVFAFYAELSRSEPLRNEAILGLVLLVLTQGFLLWLWFDTRYSIDNTFVYFRSGPFRGKIRIASIREVVLGATMWSGFKPALARKGIVVKYNQYDEIYFSPEDNKAFANALRELNPEIRIVGQVNDPSVEDTKG